MKAKTGRGSGYGGRHTAVPVKPWMCSFCEQKAHGECIDIRRANAGFEGVTCQCRNDRCHPKPATSADSP